jgi:hypothetical protein
MSQITYTHETYATKGLREELSDTIHMITPDETPLMSLIGRKNVDSTHPEWLTDELDTPDLANAQIEGADWTYSQISQPVRVGNYTQISDKRIIISRTADNTKKAGRKKETAREVMKKGLALRIDMELIIASNQASNAGSAGGASIRKLGGLRAWLASNDLLGGGGSSGGFNQSTGVVDAATNGSQRAFTKAYLDEAILSAHVKGGNPDTLMLSPYLKTVFSGFMDDANVAQPRIEYSKSKSNVIVATASVYASDFGVIDVVSNRQFARVADGSIARNALLLDPSMAYVGIFDDISIVDPAKTGDATKKVLVCEYTLVVPNEAAHAVIGDLYGLSASA